MEKKTIITVAPTGAWTSKDENPNLPITPKAIAEEVYECYKAGASICHLHMRNEDGDGAMILEKFEETVRLIKEKPNCDILINCTTSGNLYATDEARLAAIKTLKPEFASFVCGSMNWADNSLFINHPHFLDKLGMTMEECNTKPEIEIYDVGMVYNAIRYIERGIIKTPGHFQFILGEKGGVEATVDNLLYLKNIIPQGSTWSAVGVGESFMSILYASIAMGGHVRAGMEDSIYIEPGVKAESNLQIIERAADAIKLAGKEVATPQETRQLLHLI